MKPGPHAGDGWVTEFTQHRVGNGDPNAWAHSFEQQHGANGWASEFDHVRKKNCLYYLNEFAIVFSSCIATVVDKIHMDMLSLVFLEVGYVCRTP